MAVDVVNPRERYAGWVAPLCWLAVAFEGFDLVVLGVVLPSLLADKSWGLTPNTASLISVVGLLGVMAGALVVGTVSDYIGRRQTMLWTVVALLGADPAVRVRDRTRGSSACCASSRASASAACCPPPWR